VTSENNLSRKEENQSTEPYGSEEDASYNVT